MRNKTGEILLGIGIFGGVPATWYALERLPLDAGIVVGAVTAAMLWLGWESERFEDRRNGSPAAMVATAATSQVPSKPDRKGFGYWIGLAFVFVIASLSQGVFRLVADSEKRAAHAVSQPVVDPSAPPPGFVLDAAQPASWDAAVATFLATNCDMRDKDNLTLMQSFINEIDARTQLRDADLLARAADRVRIDGRYRHVDCR